MGNIPLFTILVLSWLSLATIVMIAIISHSAARPPTELEGLGIGGCAVLLVIGFFMHAISIDADVALRSFAFALIGANLGFGWLFLGAEERGRMRNLFLAFAPVYVGLVLGLLVHDGDVQGKQKELERVEAAKRKATAASSANGKKND